MTERQPITESFQMAREITREAERITEELRKITAQYETALRLPIEKAFDHVNPLPDAIAVLAGDIYDLGCKLTGRVPL